MTDILKEKYNKIRQHLIEHSLINAPDNPKIRLDDGCEIRQLYDGYIIAVDNDGEFTVYLEDLSDKEIELIYNFIQK